MRVPTRRRPAFDNESMTPMIDVVFLLLVFFVCASVGQKPDTLLPATLSEGATETDVELPPAAPDEFEPQVVTIGLTRDATNRLTISLNDRPLSGARELRERLSALAALDPRTQVIMDTSDNVTNQQWIAVYDLCQQLQFQSISFAIRPAG
ncbi:MAG: biopolymer transporter ExbD [Planctomycetaceae bacterium]|nr:biopolymer transporter ExbD [Planctomycetaceae bacterium]